MKLLYIAIILIVISGAAVAVLIFCTGNNGADIVPLENMPEKAGLIKVSNLRINQSIESPLLVKGEAKGFWFFEASFPVKIYDNNGFLLGVKPAQALSDWMTENFVPYEAEILFAAPSTKKGVVVLQKDNPSGLPENDDQLSFSVIFKEAMDDSQELTTSKIFLSDSNYVNEPYFDCARTIAVREVAKSTGVARAALEALLRGAIEGEGAKGYVSLINSGVRIQSLVIENGVAKVDFNEQLGYQVGGSCMVAAIRAQITDTLKQFSTVQSVVISINGRTEDILQP